MKRIILLAGLCLMLASCMVKNEDFIALQNQVADQEQHFAKEVESLRAAQTTTQSQITEVRPATADMRADIENMRVGVAQLQGRLDTVEQQQAITNEIEDKNAATLAQLAADMDKMKLLVSQMAGMLALETDMAAPGAPSGTQDAATAQAATTDTGAADAAPAVDAAQALYDKALIAFKQRNYDAAQATWAEFVKTFPKHALVQNSLFWQGESYYQMGDYARAVLAYQEVISKYPKGNKYPAALLKQGVSFIKLGKDKAGKLLLEDLIAKHPKSVEATRAKALLKQ